MNSIQSPNGIFNTLVILMNIYDVHLIVYAFFFLPCSPSIRELSRNVHNSIEWKWKSIKSDQTSIKKHQHRNSDSIGVDWKVWVIWWTILYQNPLNSLLIAVDNSSGIFNHFSIFFLLYVLPILPLMRGVEQSIHE